MVPSGFCETYFFLLSKDLGNLRQRDLTNDIYRVLVTNVASSGSVCPRAGFGLGSPTTVPRSSWGQRWWG